MADLAFAVLLIAGFLVVALTLRGVELLLAELAERTVGRGTTVARRLGACEERARRGCERDWSAG